MDKCDNNILSLMICWIISAYIVVNDDICLYYGHQLISKYNRTHFNTITINLASCNGLMSCNRNEPHSIDILCSSNICVQDELWIPSNKSGAAASSLVARWAVVRRVEL